MKTPPQIPETTIATNIAAHHGWPAEDVPTSLMVYDALLQARNPEIRQRIITQAMLRGGDSRDIHGGIIAIHRYLSWTKYHLPIFRLTNELAALLALTDVSDVKFKEVPYPFPTFMIETDLGWTFQLAGASIPIKRIFVHTYSTLRDKDVPNLPSSTLTVKESSKYETTFIMIAGGSAAELGELHSTVNLAEDSDVRSWINRTTKDHSVWSRLAEPTDAIDDSLVAAFVRIALGLSFYVSENGYGRRLGKYCARTKKVKTPDGLNEAVQKPSVWIVAPPIVVDKKIIEAAEAITESGNSPRWKVKARFVVRGHYRKQVCGPKRTERRMTWIRPFWKGPKEGERLTRTYAAGGNDDGG